jgi:S-adenosylmethionine:tRNA ribosyltransferase-isomerase
LDRMSDYDYELPPDRIAQAPLDDRAASRMLHLDRVTGEIRHRHFRDIVDVLASGDTLVLNETRVTALRLFGEKPTGGKVELLMLRRVEDHFEALVKPGRRLKPGQQVLLEGGLTAEIGEHLGGPTRAVRVSGKGMSGEEVDEYLRRVGRTPLPPYVHAALADPERYQTVFNRVGGSAAAPTAGLHFTSEVLQSLKNKGVSVARIVLDVSMDTFRPVEVENLDEHAMHGERATLSAEAARAIESCRGRVVAVGTTVVRTLESFAVGPRKLSEGTMETRLFIRPGFRFQIVDGLLTNFHMPRTTMLVLVSSLAGRDRVLAAYRSALQGEYRFLSFGDAMLVI